MSLPVAFRLYFKAPAFSASHVGRKGGEKRRKTLKIQMVGLVYVFFIFMFS